MSTLFPGDEECDKLFNQWFEAFPRSMTQRVLRHNANRRIENTGREKRKQLSPAKKAKLYAKQDGRCDECREPFPIRALEDHHRDPNRQDFNADKNWALLCHACHKEKGALSVLAQSKKFGKSFTDIVEGYEL
jgi:5-methylcytosine-specific restriction endonuclease McrA